ncbi:hypothetical protein FQR65_LT02657 [Abscondita terminalis]|nr:hypothetical protein FQR65_LT02657 [Abscondita terminalis]
MEGILEIVFFIGCLYWFWPNLFIEGASRANKMVDMVTNRMFDAMNRFAPTQQQQNDSLASIGDLKRFVSEQRTRRILAREADHKARENQLYEIKETVPPIEPIKSRPLMGLTCYSCTPISRESLVNKTTKNLGLKNILNEHPAIKKTNLLTRAFCHFSQCYQASTFSYAQVGEVVLKDERVKTAIEKTTLQQYHGFEDNDEDYYQQLWNENEKRARKLLTDMQSIMSDFLLKVTSWVLYKLLPCFLNSVVVHSGQIQMLKDAGQNGLPLIFLPLHKSHLDYIMISFILLNNNIRCPLIAAGDNLRMPVFGSLLRRLGAFYIKRRIDPIMGQKDHVYKAILHSYMNAGLRAGHNLEFFIEGGRTRTGKPLMPKYGIFSVVIDAFMDGTIEDALLVPVSINYEKLVDGSFAREQLGQPKQMETFGSAMKSIWHVLNSNYGMVRIDFNQPFSLRELVKTFNNGKVQNDVVFSKKLKSNPSTTSLYGTDIVSDEHKYLVENISKHVLYDCARSTSVMSTNAVAFLLMHKFRQGVTLEVLGSALDELRRELVYKQKDVGFSGNSLDIIRYAVGLFGPSLIKKEKIGNDIFIKPVITLPNVIDLNYYSNTLVTYYCLEGIIATVLTSLDLSIGEISEEELVEACLDLCNILQYEFIFCKPCQNLESAIADCIEDLTIFKEIFVASSSNTVEVERSRRIAEELFDEEEGHSYALKKLKINNKKETQDFIKFSSSLLTPLVESYSVAAFCMDKLVGHSISENDLIREILDEMTEQLRTGSINYEESVSSDSIKNVFKLLINWGIIESYNENKRRFYNLKQAHDNTDSVRTLCGRIDKYRQDFPQLE